MDSRELKSGDHILDGDDNIQDIASRESSSIFNEYRRVIPVSPWVFKTQYNAGSDLSVYNFIRNKVLRFTMNE
jgi:hypothetical protein